MRDRIRSSQHGASTVEFVIIGLLFLALLGGLFEMAYVFRTKITLNRVAMEAARSGAVNNALKDRMNDAVARGMAPLYMSANRSMAGLAAALVKAKSVGAVLAASGRLVQIISPTKQVYELFKTEQVVSTTIDKGVSKRQYVIPNDNLNLRTRSTKAFTANGKSAQINLQDANLLKIRVWWCHVLVVPGLDRVIHGIVSTNILGMPVPVTKEQAACNAVALGSSLGNSKRYAIPISASAVVRMQTPVVYYNDNLPG